MHEIFVHLLILSYTVTSRENVYHLSPLLEEPRSLSNNFHLLDLLELIVFCFCNPKNSDQNKNSANKQERC